MGKGGFNVKGVPLSKPLKEMDDPLPVDAEMLNSPAEGQSATVDAELHTTCLATVKTLVDGVTGGVTGEVTGGVTGGVTGTVGIVPFVGIGGDDNDDGKLG
jgi:hypothetical protein